VASMPPRRRRPAEEAAHAAHPTADVGREGVFVATRLGGELVHVLGEPEAGYPTAALTGQRWVWRAFGGPSVERRRRAEGLRARPGARPQRLDDPDGPGTSAFDGLRMPEGWFLLTRDDEGWYVVAERRAAPEARTDEAVFAELRSAVRYVRTRASPVR
jgi:hypothetical protein